jgi:hypothetical protein
MGYETVPAFSFSGAWMIGCPGSALVPSERAIYQLEQSSALTAGPLLTDPPQIHGVIRQKRQIHNRDLRQAYRDVSCHASL